MSDIRKIDRTGNSKTHIHMYVRSLSLMGFENELLPQLFQKTWTGATSRQFLQTL
ncbi:hypothetical protein ACSBR1_015915 [Camellia fascicularis]